MKIVDVCEFYAPEGGGVRNYVEQKFVAAAKRGHELTVIAPGAKSGVEERDAGRIRWIEAPVLPVDKNYRMFWRSADVWRVLDAESPDVVEGSSPWRGGWIAGRWPGDAAKALFMHVDPVAVYPQNWLGGVIGHDRVDRAFGWFWKYLQRLNAQFDATIVAGTWLGERFSDFGLRRLEVIPFGVDRAIFGPQHRSAELRLALLARCGLGEDAALLVAVGRHHPEKRFDVLIDAVQRVHKSRPIGLIILGDGVIRGLVDRWAARHGNVHVLGHVGDRAQMATIMASADWLLHGSSCETFGFAVAEALCSGTPVIVPDRGGAAALARDAYAETYRAGDRDDAARAVLRALSGNRVTRSRAVLDAVDGLVGTVEDHFDRLFDTYARLAAARNRGNALAAA